MGSSEDQERQAPVCERIGGYSKYLFAFRYSIYISIMFREKKVSGMLLLLPLSNGEHSE